MNIFPKFKRWVLFCGGIALYGALVFYGVPMLLMFASYGALLIAACGIAITFSIQCIAPGTRPWSRLVILRFSSVGGIAVAVLVSLPINGFFQKRAAAEAKAYSDLVAPLLEEYRQQHGNYPSSLDQVPPRPFVPRLLRDGYHSYGDSYLFAFSDPDDVFGSWTYTSGSRTWRRYSD